MMVWGEDRKQTGIDVYTLLGGFEYSFLSESTSRLSQ